MRAKSGFTLVEILIVVVILGILAAIVIPQFTEASTEAKTSRVASDLQMLRSQVELYKVQHGDLYPTAADYEDQLTGKTDAAGATYVAGTSTTGPFGPYMQKIPSNPFAASGGDDITIVTAATDTWSAVTTAGWWLNTATGELKTATASGNGEDTF